MKLPVTEIQRFCMHDGAGIRTVVFFKGCPLRCQWCHNPETQELGQEMLYYKDKCISCGGCASVCPEEAHSVSDIHHFDRTKCVSCEMCSKVCPSGAMTPAKRDMSIEEIFAEIERDRAFYGTNGGVTLSGGEPLIHGEGIVALLKLCKENNISTAIETCGYVSPDILKRIAPYTDCFLWDIKDTDSERHRRYTGVPNERIIENLLLVDGLGVKSVMRCIIVRGVNDDEAHTIALAGLFARLSNCECIELIPYHAYGGSKMLPLGKADNGKHEWIPTDGELLQMRSTLASLGIKVK